MEEGNAMEVVLEEEYEGSVSGNDIGQAESSVSGSEAGAGSSTGNTAVAAVPYDDSQLKEALRSLSLSVNEVLELVAEKEKPFSNKMVDELNTTDSLLLLILVVLFISLVRSFFGGVFT